MSHSPTSVFTRSLLVVAVAAGIGCGGNPGPVPPTPEQAIARGGYLVRLAGCNDCHTPKVFDAGGMHEDENRQLSGHPEDAPLPDIDPNQVGPGKWLLFNDNLTAAAGPWGVSFAANLTPDEETGIGAWSEAVFVNAMRRGKHMGSGRPLLPPMPWFNVAAASDEDLAAIFAYLQSLPPVKNHVPEPIPPSAVGGGAADEPQ